jgi:LuxR family maltose regulon positive regulatory protein
LAFDLQQEKRLSGEALTHAVALAEPEGYVWPFVAHGPPMSRLLYNAAARRAYAGRLLAAFPQSEPATVTPLASEAGRQELVQPLSEREIEVLQLVSEGLTNREVAQALYLSPYTVRAHLSNIYGKLGVHKRTEAVARARTLGIFNS